MKRTLTELFDSCEPEELDQLLSGKLGTLLPEDAMKRIQKKAFEKAFPKKKKKRFSARPWLRAAAAACVAFAVGLGGVAYAAEVREYGAAMQFFDENGLSTDGLSREDVKAVYRDITTERFDYDKTAEVIERSVEGVEIFQKEPTPEELAALWNNRPRDQTGVNYRFDAAYSPDDELGFDVFDKCRVERYEGEKLVWRAEFSRFIAKDCTPVAGGTAVWGYTDTWSSEQPSWPGLALVDDAGKVLWEKQLDHGFHLERIEAVLDNGDGTWAVISRGEFEYLCLSRYSDKGEELSFRKTEVGNYGIWNAARLGSGYLVQLGSYTEGEYARLVKMDREGNLTDSFVYEGKDCCYYLKDMTEFNGRMYLSAYAVPKLADEERNAGGRYEIADILNYLFDKGVYEIPSEELTPMVRDNYTAVLLVFDPEGGVLETFYSVKGSLGAGLTVSDGGELLWDVESVVSTEFSLATSAYTIKGTCQVYCYTFDSAGTLVHQENTGETAAYYR